MKQKTYNKSITHKKLRRYVIALLIVLSLVVTASTFAYWFGTVSAADLDAEGTLQIGYGSNAETSVTIAPGNLGNSSYLVPVNQIDNSISEAVDNIDLDYSIVWIESASKTQTDGETIEGIVDSQINYDIVIEGETESLDKVLYESIYNLINIEASELNSSKIELNDTSPSELQFNITLDEPNTKTEYDLIKNSKILINFTFSVNTDIYDLDLDFTKMTKTELLSYEVESTEIDGWNFDNDALYTKVYDGRIYFPISNDDYIVTATVTLPSGTGGGYGILFDTILEDDDSDTDSGYIFQFDRGYSNGQMIVRPRIYGSERNPVWSHESTDDYLFPNKTEDPSWWTAEHEIKIEVSNIDSETREAKFYIDDKYLGSYTYEDTIDDEQVYIGFRGWSSSYAEYSSLRVE